MKVTFWYVQCSDIVNCLVDFEIDLFDNDKSKGKTKVVTDKEVLDSRSIDYVKDTFQHLEVHCFYPKTGSPKFYCSTILFKCEKKDLPLGYRGAFLNLKRGQILQR